MVYDAEEGLENHQHHNNSTKDSVCIVVKLEMLVHQVNGKQ